MYWLDWIKDAKRGALASECLKGEKTKEGKCRWLRLSKPRKKEEKKITAKPLRREENGLTAKVKKEGAKVKEGGSCFFAHFAVTIILTA
jgi:hypothetical protein